MRGKLVSTFFSSDLAFVSVCDSAWGLSANFSTPPLPTWEFINLKSVRTCIHSRLSHHDGGICGPGLRPDWKLTASSANGCQNHVAILNWNQQSTSGSTLDNGKLQARYVTDALQRWPADLKLALLVCVILSNSHKHVQKDRSILDGTQGW